MPTLGEELKRRREEQGITLSEIAESTRIGTRFLKSIEEGNFSTLPGGIFTRSFIRAYAKKVGMDEDEAITLYHQQTSEETADPGLGRPEEEPPPLLGAPGPELRMDRQRRGPGWAGVLVVAGALFLVGIIAVMLLKRSNDGAAKTGNDPTAAKDPTSRQPVQPPGASGQQPGTLPASTSGSGQPIAITLEATNGASWVRYQVDQGETATLTLQPGESKSLPPAHDEIKLSLGNRTTLKLKIDNRDANFPAGTPNFAAQVVISHDNLRSYIPQ
jgi:cytoskeleton protein RodZ